MVIDFFPYLQISLTLISIQLSVRVVPSSGFIISIIRCKAKRKVVLFPENDQAKTFYHSSTHVIKSQEYFFFIFKRDDKISSRN